MPAIHARDERDGFRRLGAKGRREPALEGGLDVGGGPLGLGLTHARPDRLALGRAAIVRRVQNRERRDPVRTVQRGAAGDHAAEGEADESRPLDAAAVHEPEQLAGEHREVGRAVGRRALAVPQQVVSQCREMRRERRELPLPHRAVEPEAVDQHHRRPAALPLPGRAHPQSLVAHRPRQRRCQERAGRHAKAGMTSSMKSLSERFCSFMPRPRLA